MFKSSLKQLSRTEPPHVVGRPSDVSQWTNGDVVLYRVLNGMVVIRSLGILMSMWIFDEDTDMYWAEAECWEVFKPGLRPSDLS